MSQPDSASSSWRQGESVQKPAQARSWLRLAQLAWYPVAVLVLALFLVSIPAYLQALSQFLFLAAPVQHPTLLERFFNFVGLAASMSAALISMTLSLLLFWRKRSEPMALFMAYYLLIYAIVLAGPLEALNLYWAGSLDFSLNFAQPILLAAPTVALFCLFPNGRLVPRWTRWLVLAAVLLTPLLVTLPPYTYLRPAGPWLVWAASFLWVAIALAALYAPVYRYRHDSDALEKQQTRWAIFGFALWVVVVVLLTIPYVWRLNQAPGAEFPLWAHLSATFWWLSLNIIPVTLAIAIMRYRLWDLNLILNRTLVYGGLTLIVVALYISIVAGLGALFQAQGNLFFALLATGLVALIFQPLRGRLQQGVNRLLYGERDDPVTVLTRLSRQLEVTAAPEAALPGLVETTARALKLPYVAIALWSGDQETVAAEYGRPLQETEAYPLVYQGETIGCLRVAPRSPGEAFSPADERLLATIAQQAGAAVHAVQLTADLQRSRQRLVTAREEERRRLRRDLHDGLGPTLAAHLLKIGSARAALQRDPATADHLLDELEDGIEATLDQVRRLVYNLRPPELDQLGLLGAVEGYAAQYGSLHHSPSVSDDDPSGLQIALVVPDQMRPLPAAAEVAAYRILQEALNNVVRHAQATHCLIQIDCDRQLRLVIEDDGRGLPAQRRSGVGLTSMRERAAELGGSCEIAPGPNGGTRVEALLPIA